MNYTEINAVFAKFMGFPFVTEVTVYNYGMDFTHSYDKETIYSNKEPILGVYNENFLGQLIERHENYFDPMEQDEDFHRKVYLTYDKSWDELIPVAIKCLENQIFGSQSLIDDIQSAAARFEFDQLYGAVSQFIEWYNQNKEA